MRNILIGLLAVVIIAIGFFGFNALKTNKKKKKPAAKVSVQTVFVENVNNELINAVITESGRLVAKRRVELFSEVQGVMNFTPKDFRPGNKYAKGDVLFSVFSDDYKVRLLAQKSTLQNLVASLLPDLKLDYPNWYAKWLNYLNDFDIQKQLKPLPELSGNQEKYFLASRNLFSVYYTTKNMELTYQKYTHFAPFNGVLSLVNVTEGSLVRQGQKLGEFVKTGEFELTLSISKNLSNYVELGDTVMVYDPEQPSIKKQAKVKRINNIINSSTQTVDVYVEVLGKDFKEGTFLNALIEGVSLENAFEINRNLLVDTDKLYVVNNKRLELVTVDVVFETESKIVVRGLNNGMQVVMKRVPGAYHGMAVTPKPLQK